MRCDAQSGLVDAGAHEVGARLACARDRKGCAAVLARNILLAAGSKVRIAAEKAGRWGSIGLRFPNDVGFDDHVRMTPSRFQ